VARLWGYGLKDGPIPEVYEAWESPVKNLMSPQQSDPAAFIGGFMNERGTAADYPYIGTTYRCTEHWQTGIMTRNLPWLVEMMPNMYVELGEDLAGSLGIESGDKVMVSSARGEIEAVAVVTKRFKQMTVDGKAIHHVGVLNHWGYSGMSKGDSANILTPHTGDANTTIPEYKTFLCNVRRA
jgi:formate dehydrogenase major subunit